MSIFTHVTVGTNDLSKARKFYDQTLGKLGFKRLADLGDNGSIWGWTNPRSSCSSLPTGNPPVSAMA